ncbi:MAG: phosphatase PAP2 family protein [Ilyomonas sp.]
MFGLYTTSITLLLTFLHSLDEWDKWLFLKINNDWTNSFFDSVFPWWRDQNAWLPLYLFLLLFLLFNFGWKVWPYIFLVIITVVITDQLSSTLLKNWVNRPRPCNDVLLKYQVRLLTGYCPGSGSFTSSHATNHFGAAFLFFRTLKPYFKNWSYLFFFWAATISYGQIYIGIHYPLDVAGGAILGSFTGILMAWLYKRFIPLHMKPLLP